MKSKLVYCLSTLKYLMDMINTRFTLAYIACEIVRFDREKVS